MLAIGTSTVKNYSKATLYTKASKASSLAGPSAREVPDKKTEHKASMYLKIRCYIICYGEYRFSYFCKLKKSSKKTSEKIMDDLNVFRKG